MAPVPRQPTNAVQALRLLLRERRPPKDAYATAPDAKRSASIIRKESGVSLRAYPCQCGNGWHLTKS